MSFLIEYLEEDMYVPAFVLVEAPTENDAIKQFKELHPKAEIVSI
jgi:hypothetical protein